MRMIYQGCCGRLEGVDKTADESHDSTDDVTGDDEGRMMKMGC